jgi:hypothetical protein
MATKSHPFVILLKKVSSLDDIIFGMRKNQRRNVEMMHSIAPEWLIAPRVQLLRIVIPKESRSLLILSIRRVVRCKHSIERIPLSESINRGYIRMKQERERPIAQEYNNVAQ